MGLFYLLLTCNTSVLKQRMLSTSKRKYMYGILHLCVVEVQDSCTGMGSRTGKSVVGFHFGTPSAPATVKGFTSASALGYSVGLQLLVLDVLILHGFLTYCDCVFFMVC